MNFPRHNIAAPSQPGWCCGLGSNFLLVWLLCGAIAAPSFLLPRTGAVARFGENPRPSEEGSDPIESPYEEQHAQPLATSVGRDRHLHSLAMERPATVFTSAAGARSGLANPSPLRPAELVGRNGSGGPLRC